MTNNGTKSTIIDWNETTFSWRKVAFIDNDDTPSYSDKTHVKLQSEVFLVGRSILRPNQTSAYTFLTKLNDSGIYYLEFTVPIPPDELEDAIDAGISRAVVNEGKWITRKYISVD